MNEVAANGATSAKHVCTPALFDGTSSPEGNIFAGGGEGDYIEGCI